MPPLEKGSNWIVVTDRFRDFVFDYLRTHPDYIRAFRHSHCGDEIFFQTLMGSLLSPAGIAPVLRVMQKNAIFAAPETASDF